MLKDPSVVGRGWAITQVTRGAVGPRAAQNPNAKDKSFLGYSLRTPRWRYTEWDEGNQGRELYDHDNDPLEQTNLATKPEFAKTVGELSVQIRSAAKSTFPPSGETPDVKTAMWAPLLTEP